MRLTKPADERTTVVRLTLSFLGVFLIVILALSVLAYVLIAGSYRATLGPALSSPEGRIGLALALRSVALSVGALDLALALAVGAISYALARAAVHPLALSRAREAQFAADAAHELRTPLGTIASVAQAAAGAGPDEQSRALRVAAAAALEASDLIGDLLTLARDPNARALAREPVDLAALTHAVVGETYSETRGRGVAFELALESVIVDGDERRLRQLLRNLLGNAIRHARSRIDIRIAAGGRLARLEIEDDGTGVDDATRAHLFERFAKGADSDGNGLGLAICRWIARSHAGEVVLEDRSRFVVTLPIFEGAHD